MRGSGGKLFRALGWVMAVLVGIPAALLMGAMELLRWPAVQERGRELLVDELRKTIPGLELASLEFDPLGRVTVAGLQIKDATGQPAVRLAAAVLRLDLSRLLLHEVAIEDALLVEPRLRVRRLRDGRLNLATLTRRRPEARPSTGPTAWKARIDHLELDRGTAELVNLAGGPARVDLLDLRGAARLAARRIQVQLAGMHLRGVVGARPVDLRVEGEGALRSSHARAHLRLVASGLLPRRPFSVEVTLRGPLEHMVVALRLDGADAGSLTATGSVGLPLTYDLTLGLDGIRPRRWRADLPPGLIRGALHARGRGAPTQPQSVAELRGRLISSRVAGVPVSSAAVRGELHGRAWKGEGELRLPGLHVRARGNGGLRGPLAVDARAELVGTETLPARLGALRGSGDIEVHLRGRPRDLAGETRLRLARLAGRGWTVRGISASARASGLPARPSGSVLLDATSLRVGTAAPYRDLRVRAAGGRRAFWFDAAASGRGVGARVVAKARQVGRTWLAELDELRLRHPDLTMALLRPAHVSWSKRQGLTVSPMQLALRGGELQLEGGWRPGRRPRGELRLRASHVSLPGGGPVSGRLRAQLRDQRVTTEVAASLGEGGSVQLAGRLPLRRDWRPDRRRPLEAKVHVADLDLARIERALSWAGGPCADRSGPACRLAGRLSVDATAGGRLDDPRLQARVRLKNGQAGPVGGLDLDAALAVEDRRSEVKLEGRLQGGPPLRLEGQVGLRAATLVALANRKQHGVPDAPVHLAVDVQRLDLGYLALLASRPAPRLLEGQLALALSLEGTLLHPRAELRVAASSLRYAAYQPDRVEANLRIDAGETTKVDGGLQLRGAPVLNVHGETASLDRLLGPEATRAPVRGHVAMPGFALSELPSIRPDLVGFGGLLQGEADLDGTIGQPGVRASVRVRDPELRGQRLQKLAASGGLSNGQLHAAIELRQAGPGALKAQLQTGLANRQRPLSARLSASALELDQLQSFFPDLRALGGRVDGTLTAGGTLSDPRLAGGLRLSDGRLGLIGAPTLERVGVRLSLADDEVRLDQLVIPFGKGKLEVRGLARLRGFWPAHVEARAAATSLPLELVGVTNASFDGKLSFMADLDRRAGMRGEVALDQGVVKLAGLPGATRKLYPAGPLADVHYVASLADVPPPRRRPPSPALVKGKIPQLRRRPAPAFPVELAVTARSLFIRGNEMNTELAAKLRLQQRGRNRVLLGDVRASGGWVEILKRRYDLEQALASFNGEPQINPALAVTLSRRFPDAEVYIRVSGTARDPQLDLSSDPPIYDRPQVIALILTGQPTMASEGGGGSSLGLASVIVQVLVGRLASAIAPGVGIDVLRLEQVNVGEQTAGAAAATGPAAATEKATELEVGKYLTERLYVGYRRLFGAPQGENSNEGRLEYRISSNWSLESVFGDAGVGGLDLFWTHLY